MDVVGIVLGVVILDQKCRALDPIVVGLSPLERPSPGEMYLVEACAAKLIEARSGDVGGHITRILFDERSQKFRLLLVHPGGRQSDRRAHIRAAGIGAEDILRRLLLKNGYRPLFFIESLKQIAGAILFSRQRSQALARPVAYFRRIGPEERRRTGYQLPFGQSEVQ